VFEVGFFKKFYIFFDKKWPKSA